MLYKLVAPDVDRLVRCFEKWFQDPEQPSADLMNAMNPLFETLKDLAPLPENDEAKVIWITVPVGDLSDYGSYEDALECGAVESYQEFQRMWKEEYPDDVKWYRLTIGESKPGSRFAFRSVAVDNTGIISVDLSTGLREETWWKDDKKIELCRLLTEAASQAIQRVRDGTYNDFVNENLPYQHRTGVIKRSDEWLIFPEAKDRTWNGIDEDLFQEFKGFLETNNSDKIGRIKVFTANDFFRACVCGYRACGYHIESSSPVWAYLRYADGRDEGLTGAGHGLNAGPGINYDDPKAWDEWYNDSRVGGHPWEVIRGGNSTHVDLIVMHDDFDLGYLLRLGRISQEEYDSRMKDAGYYFLLAGKHRSEEVINFFVALRKAGYPVVLRDADEILARLEGTDYIGIVPHRVIPKYCESMFPDEYGHVIDFMHIYADEDEQALLPYITWLPEEKAELLSDSRG